MVSLKQLFEWFTTGKFPTEAQFAEQFKSFWHKSERIAMSYISGLVAALNGKANIDDVAISLLYLPDVTTKNDLYTTYPNPKNGEAALVEDEDYIYQFRSDLNDWVKTPFKTFSSDVVTQGQFSLLSNEIAEITNKSFTSKQLGTTTGAVTKAGTVATSAAGYLRTSVVNNYSMLLLEDETNYYYTGNIDNNSYCGVAYFNDSLQFISWQFGTGNYVRGVLIPPFGAKYAGVCGVGGFLIEESSVSLKLLQDEGFDTKMAVSQSGVAKSVRDALGYVMNGKREYKSLIPVASKDIKISFPLRSGVRYKLTLTVNATATANFRGVTDDGTIETIGTFGTVASEGVAVVIEPSKDYDYSSIYFGAATEATTANLLIEVLKDSSTPEPVGTAVNIYPDPFCLYKGDFGSIEAVQAVVRVGVADYSVDGKIILPVGAFLGINIWESKVGVATGTDYLNAMFLGTKPDGAIIAIRVDQQASGRFATSYPLQTDGFYNDWMSLYNSKSTTPSLSGRFQVMFDNRNGTTDLVVERFYLWKGLNQSIDGLFMAETQKVIHSINSGNLTNGLVKEENLFAETVENVSLGKTTGALTKTGGIANVAEYRRTTITNNSSGFMITINPLKSYTYSGEIDNASYCGVFYKNESMAFVGYECGDTRIYEKHLLTPPSDAKFIAFCGKDDFSVEQINKYISIDLLPTDSGGFVSRYVDGSVGVSGDGSKDYPYKTITEAIEYVADKGFGLVIVKDGDYREKLPLAKLKTGNFKIVPYDFAKGFRVLGSNKLEGWTKTAGYANVYETPFTGNILTFARLGGALLFEDGKPSKEIEARHYHPLQKNLSHRLPFSPIYPKESIADVDGTPASYFYDTDNAKLYLHTSDSDDPATNAYSYEVIARGFNTYVAPASQTQNVNIEIIKARFMYGTAFIARGFAEMRRRFCTSLACTNAGAWMNDSGYIETFYEESGFCNNDGENSHFSAYSGYPDLENNRAMSPTVKHDCLWTHDNGDDGESSHELHNVIITNSLLEFNGDSGSRPSNDATYYVTNSIFRNNGWEVTINGTNTIPSRGGEGFSVVNPVSANPNRKGCRAVLIGCVFEENNVGLAAISQANNYVEAIDCISRNNNTEIYASSGAKVVVRNHKATNADPNKIKVTATGGTIEVLNDELVE